MSLFKTDDSWAGLILRMGLGGVIFAHGAQKLLGWFGGNGFEGTMGFFTQTMGLSWVAAFLVIIGESLGSLGLIAGFLTRFTAASFVVIMHYDRRDCHGALAAGVFHELVRTTTGRRFRISFAGHCHERRSDCDRRREMVYGWRHCSLA